MSRRPINSRFSFFETADGALFVTGRALDSRVSAGDIITSVNGKRDQDMIAELYGPGERRFEVIDALTGKLRTFTSKQLAQEADSEPVYSNFHLAFHYLISGLIRRAKSTGEHLAIERIQALTRQRRILAYHLRDCIRAKRGLEELLDDQWNRYQRDHAELSGRLAATSRALAEAIEQRIDAQARMDRLLDVIEESLRAPKPVTLVDRARKFLQALRPHKTQKAATA